MPFDLQHASGALPYLFNDRFMVWTYCKPPIHGWTLKKLMERSDYVDAGRLAEIYEPLCKWTEWWFAYRDDDGDGIPQYHHGNDSGWDNSTVFAAMPPIEAPDLSAFLIIQMDVLAEVAEILGKPGEARAWQSRANNLLENLLAHSWRGDQFVASRSGTHETFDNQSLLLYVPIILGERLPEAVRAPLVAALKDKKRFLTPYGLATEMPSSLAYEPDGYWRGPIWAPSTMILVDGLAAAGERAFARELSRRFCDMAVRNGMAENYDALTGEGLRDRAYTWTSSVFLILAHEYLL
jgi:glycogen debranching enzyme